MKTNATTSERPGGAPENLAVLHTRTANHVPRKWSRHYRKLMALRERYLEESRYQSNRAIEAGESFSGRLPDNSAGETDRSIALSQLAFDKRICREIEEALGRISAGTYGICELTGNPIPEARLEAIPWTRYTVEAESMLEQQHEAIHARLGKSLKWKSAFENPQKRIGQAWRSPSNGKSEMLNSNASPRKERRFL